MDVVIDIIGSGQQCPSYTNDELIAMVENTKVDDNGEQIQTVIEFVAQHCYYQQYDVLTKFFNMIDVNTSTMFGILCCLRTSWSRHDVIEGWKPLITRAYKHFMAIGEDVDDAFTGLTRIVDKP